MKLQFPKTVPIGRKRFRVVRAKMDDVYFGRIFYGEQLIKLTTRRDVRRERLEETFWHEVLHGLIDRINPEYDREVFVRALAKDLTRVIREQVFR